MTLQDLEPRLIFYDFEVFAYDWLVVFQDCITSNVTVFHNNPEDLIAFISQDMILCGYNNKHYDQYILKAIAAGLNPKDINDYIVTQGGNGWEYPELEGKYISIPPQIDLMQDTQQISLKEIEGNIGWDIKETEVDFRIDRPLTTEELEKTKIYCMADVKILPELWKLRRGYLEAKLTLCEMAGIPPEQGLPLTNAKLTAKFLGAKLTTTPNRRDFDYKTIPNVMWEYIPLEVQEYFDNVRNESMSDEEFEESKLKIDIAGVPHIVALGGLHGAIPNYQSESNEEEVILNYDVTSLYPSLILTQGLVSRCIPDKTLYETVYHNRLRAKKAGDKKTANALKLVLNTFYGAMNNEYNDLYDPGNNLATCIIGQILLIELINMLSERLSSFSLIQSNTDGIMFKVKRAERDLVTQVVHEWEQLHSLGMEEDVINKVVQRDVNNYVIELENGELKYKGATLVDYRESDRWKHYSLGICAEALVKKLIYDIPIEETIRRCNDLSKFQMITKTGRTYFQTVRLQDGQYVEIQKVNRVFAGKDPSKGAVYKVKYTTDKDGNQRLRYDKTANCPLCTLIDGYDIFNIEDIDIDWYIDLTLKRFKEFIGGKENGNKKRKSRNT